MAETDKVQPKPTEAEADSQNDRGGVVTGDKTPEPTLPLGKLGDNPNTGRSHSVEQRQGGQAGGR